MGDPVAGSAPAGGVPSLDDGEVGATPASRAMWLDRDVVGASGPEAASFLHGQLSQDVLALADSASAWSWVLAPNGKVDALARVSRVSGEEWVLDTDGGWGELLLARLSRFKLRTKVELAQLPWRVLALRGAGARAGAGRLGTVAGAGWPGIDGVDVLGPSLEVPPGFALGGAEEREVERVLAGLPRMGAELTEKTIPGETGLIEATVSMTKGCYTGQELVARIDSRGGHVARRLHGLALAGPAVAGTDLVSGGQPAGVLTSVVLAGPRGWVGLGYVRRGVDATQLRAGAAGPGVTIRELPAWV